jgi:hypothetical protein
MRYRFIGGNFQIWPNVTTNEYLGYEYVSNGWVNQTTTPQSSFTADADTCIFPDRLMVLGLKLRFFEVKGFDSTAYYRDFYQQLNVAKANDGGSMTLSMAPKMSSVLIGFENIPDGSIYGQG